MLIAVKRINQEGLQGHKEWLTEVYYLGKLRHPNLVTLLGYCFEDDCRLLVYEFMARGSLDSHLYGSDRSHVSTRVMGTYGYAAPEYIATGHLTGKNDAYGFGVVMLELLSGRQVLDRSLPTKEKNLVEWAKPYLTSKHRVLKIFVARIKGQYYVSAARKAANLANQCLLIYHKLRSNMNEVVN
ncbi:putative transferase, protein kinase RLK-Pelle-RLCK-VIIa-2 family [Rosa chinensis]|uniref:Putative transferase, protein kinase RLK-Pelle-RLCK-VIIa-2 family n=1 Tax=Rosa chinensis TaxID=74649 RepID=A0A2P6SKI1_ROSCH|nr:putative transferase, protein kinase RLK-Pelle-RLCK-VIIa-2 family [Rosa chinensis]